MKIKYWIPQEFKLSKKDENRLVKIFCEKHKIQPDEMTNTDLLIEAELEGLIDLPEEWTAA